MLPNAFCERMKALLGEEYDAFYRAMTEEPPVGGYRINTAKCGQVQRSISHALRRTGVMG